MDSDDEGSSAVNDYVKKHKEHKEKKERKRLPSGSDSSGDERRKEREKERKERKEKQRDKERRDKDSRKSRDDERRKKESKPKFFRDIKPEKILGVTTGPGELNFYIQWDSRSGQDPGLVSAKEAYQKIPQMCLKFYENHLIWNKPKAKEVKPSADDIKEVPKELKSDETAVKPTTAPTASTPEEKPAITNENIVAETKQDLKPEEKVIEESVESNLEKIKESQPTKEVETPK